jgi:hypothetical protein
MLFIEAIQGVADACSGGVVDDAKKEQYKRKINIALDAVTKSHRWKDLERQGELALVPNYTTGTASVVNGSRSVTISGGSLTSDMKGRYFQATGASMWYRIIGVSGSTLTLETPIQESTASGLTYNIWKKFYRINSDVRVVLPNQFNNSLNVNSFYNQDYIRRKEFIPFTIHGTDEFSANYTTGSITVSKNSNVATGSGTSFLGNVYAGDRLKVGNLNYWIFRVDSDTQLTLYNYATDDWNDTYTIYSDYPHTAVLNFVPGVAAVLIYSYLRHVYNLINEQFDTFPLSKNFNTVIVDLASAEYKRDGVVTEGARFANWAIDMQLALAKLDTLKKNSDLEIRPFNQFAPYIPAGNGRGNNRFYIG